MSKSKYISIVALIVAVIAFIIIFDPFGSTIEGEWSVVSVCEDGNYENLTFNPTSIIFYDDGTLQKIYYNGSASDTMYYSYSKGHLAIEGTIFDCKIDGNVMNLSAEEDGHEAQVILRRK